MRHKKSIMIIIMNKTRVYINSFIVSLINKTGVYLNSFIISVTNKSGICQQLHHRCDKQNWCIFQQAGSTDTTRL